jgi:hypothetical protein
MELTQIAFVVGCPHNETKPLENCKGEPRKKYVEEPDAYMVFADPLGCGTACGGDSGTVRVHEGHSDESPPRFPGDSIRDGIPAASKVGRSRGAGPPDRAHEHLRAAIGLLLDEGRLNLDDEIQKYVPGELRQRCRCRRAPYLNNILEQDHGFVKKRILASQWFRSVDGALNTIAGYEAMNIMRKGQIRW